MFLLRLVGSIVSHPVVSAVSYVAGALTGAAALKLGQKLWAKYAAKPVADAQRAVEEAVK